MEPWFLEPSTGRRYSPSDCPYQGIEFVWSSANFWICMQVGGKPQCRAVTNCAQPGMVHFAATLVAAARAHVVSCST